MKKTALELNVRKWFCFFFLSCSGESRWPASGQRGLFTYHSPIHVPILGLILEWKEEGKTLVESSTGCDVLSVALKQQLSQSLIRYGTVRYASLPIIGVSVPLWSLVT